MRVAIGIGGPAAGGTGAWQETVAFAVEAERLGVDSAWSAEAWGRDAVSPLAYLAARTTRLRLGAGIMQISARVPAMTAMTALTLAELTGGRFLLGLGASGPQVVEGLHGVPFAGAVGRLRETIEIVRLALRGERIEHHGRHFELPLPGGEGKPLRLAAPPASVPIYLASLSPKSLELAGELADGWLGTSFVPEQADAALRHLRAGAARAGRPLAGLDLQAGGRVAFGDDVERLMAAHKPMLAFTLGAMGSARHNFYNDAFRRAGYEDAARAVQALWLAGRRDEAASRVPDEMVLRTNLLGTEAMVRARVRAYRDAGITTLRVAPDGRTPGARIETLERLLDLVRQEGS
jgi:F420-dependent oxidoreductase-like protein